MSQPIIYNKFKSENYDQRKFDISLIIIHFTETKTFNDALNLLTSIDRKVSSHYLIDKSGDIFNLVDLDKRAWHAGESMWANYDDINSRSIGIEVVNSGEVFQEDYTAEQLAALQQLTSPQWQNFEQKFTDWLKQNNDTEALISAEIAAVLHSSEP